MSGWQPTPATALLILEDGTRLEGRGIRGVLDWLLKTRTALDDERRSQSDLREALRQTDLRLRHALIPNSEF